MKRFITIFIITLFSFLLINSCCNPTSSEDDIFFSDPNFEKAIRLSLNQPDGKISNDDLKSILYIDATVWPYENIYDAPISSISGIEYCINLENSFFGGHTVKDFKYLKNLNYLEILVLANNEITDISTLTGPEHLQVLNLSNNNIADITSLANLKGLKHLTISGNDIKDFSPLKNLSHLATVFASNNKVTDLSLFPKLLSIFRLHLSKNQITDISDLPMSSTLKYLNLSNNQISDISVLTNFDLYYIGLSDNQISDIKPLVDNIYFYSDLYDSKRIDLYNNPLSQQSIEEYIPLLEARGIEVFYDSTMNNTKPRTFNNPFLKKYVHPITGEMTDEFVIPIIE